MNSLDLEIIGPSVTIKYKERGLHAEEIGMTHVTLVCDSWDDQHRMDFNPILNKYSSTVEHLDLDIDVANDVLYDVQYPRLKTLVLDSLDWWIPRNAPMLQELAISSYTIHTHPAVLDTIPPDLITPELRLADEPFSIDKTFIATYLHRLGHQSQLKNLIVFCISSDDIGTMLDAICHLGRLDSLVIHVWRYWDNNEMEGFFGKLVIGCPRLRLLRINCQNAPSTTSINTLKRLGHLTQLAFSVHGIDNHYGFWHAIQTFSQLRYL